MVWALCFFTDIDLTVEFQDSSWIHSSRWPMTNLVLCSVSCPKLMSPSFHSLWKKKKKNTLSFYKCLEIRAPQHLMYKMAIISRPCPLGHLLPSLDLKAKRLISCGPWKRGAQFKIQLHIPFEWNWKAKMRREDEDEEKEGMGDSLNWRLRPWTQREGKAERGVRSAEADIHAIITS